MISKALNLNCIKVHVKVNSWEEAVRHAGDLLFKDDAVEQRFIDSMVQMVKDYGPYIAISKGVALAHARPEDGAKRIGLSLITLWEPINFGNEHYDPISVVFGLSAIDNVSHLDLISELATLLDQENILTDLNNCDDETEVMDLINGYFQLNSEKEG